MILSVWSSYGHRFMNTGEYADDDFRHAYESCMTCGAEFILRDCGDNQGAYEASNGDAPIECSDRTDLSHGYEAVCENDNGRPCQRAEESGTCEHIAFECNCVLCTG